MSLDKNENIVELWSLLFKRYFSKYILSLLLFAPLASFFALEFHSKMKFESVIKELEPELSQSIINGDSNLAFRLLNSIIKTLDLEYVELKEKTQVFASAGNANESNFTFLKWTKGTSIEGPWGNPVGMIYVRSSLFPPERLLGILFLGINLFIFYLVKRILVFYNKEFLPILTEIQELTQYFSQSFSENKIQDILYNKKFSTKTAHNLSNSIKQFLQYREDTSIRILKLEKNEEMSAITKQVAHDIRSPLSVLNLLIASIKTFNPEQYELINSALKRINDIANDLLDRSRSYRQSNELIKSSSNRQALNTKVNVVAVIKNILMEKELLALNKINFEFINQVPSDSDTVEIFANEIEISRVISNLINNSMEAFCFDEKGLTPPLEFKIIIHLVKNEDKLFLTIQDNGVGIPESVLSQIGKMGFSHGKGITGNGLGLHHANQILKSLNGDLTIDSQYGKGTTVALIFPYS